MKGKSWFDRQPAAVRAAIISGICVLIGALISGIFVLVSALIEITPEMLRPLYTRIATRSALPTMSPSPIYELGPMTGEFNIAVAEFGQVNPDGNIVPSRDGALLSNILAARLRENPPGLFVQVCHKGVGIIQGATPQERAWAAAELAKNVNAHMVIYGNLTISGDVATFSPEFYVENLKEAEEMLGEHQMGSPITFTLPLDSKLASRHEANQKLVARINALIFFTYGLAYLTEHDGTMALEWFQKAAEVEGWRDEEGKEVLYLFMGAANMERDRPEVDRARMYLEKAIDLNPDYARAHVALGFCWLYRATKMHDEPDPIALNKAIECFDAATRTTFKPRHTYADVRAWYGLGLAYTIQYLWLGYQDAYTRKQAIDNLEAVTRAYEANKDDNIKSYAADSHDKLGLIFCKEGDIVRAQEEYAAVEALGGPSYQCEEPASRP